MAKHDVEFDYFHGYESEQFAFYRIPKVLLPDDYFKDLSSDAKVLYGLMLDRMSLSIKNNWIDDEDRVYIIFTLEQVMQYMNCGRDKGMKTLAELDTKKGIGLIERVKQGFGKPDVIYVKSFLIKENAASEQEAEDTKSLESSEQMDQVGKTDFLRSANQTLIILILTRIIGVILILSIHQWKCRATGQKIGWMRWMSYRHTPIL